MLRFGFATTLLLLAPAAAGAQAVISSPGPASVAVTIYRAQHRAADEALGLEWLEGYALISETRTITIPAGESEIRFEGVAGGIIPESAIVTGLPDGVVEKNQDAWLLSPASLLDRSLGKRVRIRRTSRATGEVREQQAVIRTAPSGGIVVQTDEGYEALQCTGIPEQIVYDGVPAGLSAKPTLSVRTRSSRPVSTTVTLSYLASGFDWQANYVARLSPSGDRMDLHAWVTLASGDETSFVEAETQTVAGRLNREEDAPRAYAPNEIQLQCWPSATTSDIPQVQYFGGIAPPPPPPPPPAAPAMMMRMEEAEDIVVTGMQVRQEELGDLKLYRIPERVTVASNSQKQVTMIDLESVPVETFYRASVQGGSAQGVRLTLRAANKKERGLGIPLPSGQLALFQEAMGRPFLVGEGALEDKAVGEEVEVEIADAANVTMNVDDDRIDDRTHRITLTARNALPKPVFFEADIRQQGAEELIGLARATTRKDGKWVWRVQVPANGTRSLSYTSREAAD